MQRKEFIRTAGRATMLAGIAAITGLLAYRGKLTTKPSCGINEQCRNCGRLAKCALPEAVKERSDV